MKIIKNKFFILSLVFIIALSAYFLSSIRSSKKEATVYTSIEEPTLPIVWVDMADRRMNCMRGYITDPGVNALYDTLTVLSQERRLGLHVSEEGIAVTGIAYEIRSADLKDLIDKGEVSDFSSQSNQIDFSIPIENYLSEWKEYRLDLVLTTEDKGEVHYYSRLMLGSQDVLMQMLDHTTSFSERNFDYNAARENTTFLESDETGDNTTLARVNLKSSYDQLTYRQLGLKPIGVKDVRLCSYDGNMGEVKISFLAGRETQEGINESYEITESFTMRMGAERLYMMDYTREMREVFLGDRHLFSGEKIELGINDIRDVSAMSNEEGSHIAFVVNRDLLLIEKKTEKRIDREVQNIYIKKLYSFRSGTDSGLRSNFDKHGIKILRVAEDGGVDFIVYGYMNRGPHEGRTGLLLNRYDPQKNIIVEQCFVPLALSAEEIFEYVATLSYIGENNMFYVKLGNAVYGIDTRSSDYIVVADRLGDQSFAVSPLGKRFAWQSVPGENGAEAINFMNLDTGEKKEIKAQEGELLCTKGFIDTDLVIGRSEDSDLWNVNQKPMPIPHNAIDIIDDALVSQEHYKRVGNYITDVEVDGSRIHLKLLIKTGEGSFSEVTQDTIVCNSELKSEIIKNLGTSDSEEKGRLCHVLTGGSKEANLHALTVPGSISYENADALNIELEGLGGRYFAYGKGRLIESFSDPVKAIQAAYPQMGTVRYQGQVFYARAATLGANSLKNPSLKAEEYLNAREEGQLTGLRGISLRQSFYYISRGFPILAFLRDQRPVIIYAYDRNMLTLYDVENQNTFKMGIEEAEAVFSSSYNDFSCFFTFY